MNKKPLFRYSINFKVFGFTGILLGIIIVLTGFAIRLGIENISIYVWLFSIIVLFGVCLVLFLHYITFPLENISTQILSLLTGKSFQKIPPLRNDEIGVITHFFNTVTDRIKDLSGDISEGKRMSSELAIAAKIQSDVLPKQAPENIIGLDIVAKSRASSEVGGDCFDFIQHNDDTIIYIGDVTGHGTPAGLVMMLVNTTIRALLQEDIDPKEVLIKTNQLLKEKISSNHYMTLVMLKWQNNKQKMSYIGAGHEYILHYSMREKIVHAIKSEGVALKMVLNISKILRESPIEFQDGDVLVLYTDGITEAKNHENVMFGIDRLKTVVLQNAHRKAPDIFDKITEEFSKFVGKNFVQNDDITMIVIKNIGQFGPTHKVELSINTEEETKSIQEEVWDWK